MRIYEEKHKKKFQSKDQQIKKTSTDRLITQEAQRVWLK